MTIDAKKAIEVAFKEFQDLVVNTSNTTAQHRLLEELKLDNGKWRVVLGFDIGRKKTSKSFPIGGADETTPIREFRTFVIDAETGRLLEVE